MGGKPTFLDIHKSFLTTKALGKPRDGAKIPQNFNSGKDKKALI
jgi:hypothetical protein